MKNIVLVLCLFLMLGFASAHDVSYKEKISKTVYYDDDFVISKTIRVDYNNDRRASTYDYRHGYSYRATSEYFDRKYDSDFDRDRAGKTALRTYESGYKHGYLDGRLDFDFGKRHSYEYVSHLRSYEGRDCYVRPPADKLFYIKC